MAEKITNQKTIKDYAEFYTTLGYAIIRAKGKKPDVGGEWEKTKCGDISPDTFSEGDNVGILTGEASNNLVDIDLDCDEAAKAFKFFPMTKMVSGRNNRPKTHLWYVIPGIETKKYNDPMAKSKNKKASLFEIRANGSQTIVEPSIHPDDKDPYRWDSSSEFEPTVIEDIENFQRECDLIASACLLARYWPGDGDRQNTTMALFGHLSRYLSKEETRKLVEMTCYIAGDEEYHSDRKKVLSLTKKRLEKKKPTQGRPELIKHIDEKIISKIEEWLNISIQSSKTSKPSLKSRFYEFEKMVLSHCDFFSDDNGIEYFKYCPSPDEKKYALCGKLRSKEFTHLLRSLYRGQYNEIATNSIIEQIISECGYKASQKQEKIYKRIASLDDKIYIDLGHDNNYVEIDEDGWKVIKYAPFNFLKNSLMKPLHMPVSGDIHVLRKYIKVKDETDYKLIIGFILGCYQPHGGYPILNIMGPEGSAKTTTANIIRNLIDPSMSEEDTLVDKTRDLAILAISQHLLSFGNISLIRQEISNMLCKLSTGGGFPTRSLFTNSDVLVFKSKNPVILNGIIDFVNRSDLASRTLKIELEKIHKHERKTEYDIYTQFDRDCPVILGGIYSVLSECIKKYKTTKLTHLMRLADFTKWITAAHEKLGWQVDDFYHAYNNKSLDDIYNRLTSQTFSKCLMKLLAVELHRNKYKEIIYLTNEKIQIDMKAMLEEEEIKKYKWANSVSSFGITMKLLVSDFAEIGILINAKKSGKRGYEFKITNETVKENLLSIDSEMEEDIEEASPDDDLGEI